MILVWVILFPVYFLFGWQSSDCGFNYFFVDPWYKVVKPALMTIQVVCVICLTPSKSREEKGSSDVGLEARKTAFADVDKACNRYSKCPTCFYSYILSCAYDLNSFQIQWYSDFDVHCNCLLLCKYLQRCTFVAFCYSMIAFIY